MLGGKHRTVRLITVERSCRRACVRAVRAFLLIVCVSLIGGDLCELASEGSGETANGADGKSL